MLSVQEISDRLEIQQLLVDYSTAIDQRRFDDLDNVFTKDAYIDYRALGGIDGRYPEVKEWLARVLPTFPVYAHMLGNISLRIDGDTASSRVICFNPMVLPAGPRSGTIGGCLPRDYELLGGHTREAKPDPGIPPGSLNCSVTHTGEIA